MFGCSLVCRRLNKSQIIVNYFYYWERIIKIHWGPIYTCCLHLTAPQIPRMDYSPSSPFLEHKNVGVPQTILLYCKYTPALPSYTPGQPLPNQVVFHKAWAGALFLTVQGFLSLHATSKDSQKHVHTAVSK